MNAPDKQVALPRAIRRGAIALAGGYAALFASLFMRDALALVILLPIGIGLFLTGIVMWGFAAGSEAKSKGML
jgi:hypothetical protein